MFANDLMLVAKAFMSNAWRLISTVENYCIQSGQRIDVQKSQIQFSKKIDVKLEQQIIGILNIPLKEGVWNYLGVPPLAFEIAAP